MSDVEWMVRWLHKAFNENKVDVWDNILRIADELEKLERENLDLNRQLIEGGSWRAAGKTA